MTTHPDLRQRTLRSLGWQLLGAGGQRVVQFVGIAVLAHLIDKAEIGLFGIVLAGVAAIEALTYFTGEQSQIHSARGADRGYLDTVFTVRLLRGLLIGAALAALAPAFAWFFHKPEFDGRYWLCGLFLALAANGLLDGIQSPARAARMKDLDFRRVALGDFAAALLGTAAQIGLAWAMRDVWALVLGTLLATLLRSLASYAVAPYRPRLRVDRAALRDLGSYTMGAAGTPFLLMLIAQGPALVIGKLLADVAMVGVYSYCERLSKIGEDICLRVLAPVAIPAYAKLKDEPGRLANAWLRSIRTILLLAVPGTVALVWIGNDLPAVVFGADYGAVAWLFPLLAFRGGIAAVNSVIGPLFWAIGEPWKDRRAQLWRTVVLYGAGVPLVLACGPAGFAGAALMAISTAAVLSMTQALARLQVPRAEVARAFAQGAGPGAALLALLLLLELLLAPVGPWRVALGCTLAAAFVAFGALRTGLLRVGVLRRSV